MKQSPKLILIRGLPGSGKSTLARTLYDNNECDGFFEADHYFEDEYGNYNFDVSKLGAAHTWCQEATDFALSKSLHVVVSNTFTTKKELKPYFELAKKYGIKPTVIACQNQYKSVHNVPPETMERMKQRFEFDISELFEDLE